MADIFVFRISKRSFFISHDRQWLAKREHGGKNTWKKNVIEVAVINRECSICWRPRGCDHVRTLFGEGCQLEIFQEVQHFRVEFIAEFCFLVVKWHCGAFNVQNWIWKKKQEFLQRSIFFVYAYLNQGSVNFFEKSPIVKIWDSEDRIANSKILMWVILLNKQRKTGSKF